MGIKILTIGIFTAFAVALGCSSPNVSTPAPATLQSDPVEIEIDRVIQKFHGKDYATTDDAMKDWILIASRSTEARKRVTEKLLGIVMNCENYFEASREYPLWRTAVGALGKMRSVEAIEILSKCIDYTDFTGGLGLQRTYPAAYALQCIGEPAIPRLKEILLGPLQKGAKRHLAVRVLQMSGREDEIIFLQDLLKTEKDKELLKTIGSALDYMNRK